MLFSICLSHIWIHDLSCACLADWLFCVVKTLALDIVYKPSTKCVPTSTKHEGWDLRPSGGQPLGSSLSRRLSSECSYLPCYHFCMWWPWPVLGVKKSSKSKSCWLHFLAHFSTDLDRTVLKQFILWSWAWSRFCPCTAGCSPQSMSSIVFCLLLSCFRWFPPSLLCRLAIFCMVILLISSLFLVATLCSVWSIYCLSFLLYVQPINTFVSVCIL